MYKVGDVQIAKSGTDFRNFTEIRVTLPPPDAKAPPAFACKKFVITKEYVRLAVCLVRTLYHTVCVCVCVCVCACCVAGTRRMVR